MITNFKFLQDNNEDEDVYPIEEMEYGYDGASWMYGTIENLDQYQYDIIVGEHHGIHSFLNHFPPGYVACVISITGPNGIIHNAENDGDGWGFDITSDLIRVEWVRFTH
jgi:hypothetical protein